MAVCSVPITLGYVQGKTLKNRFVIAEFLNIPYFHLIPKTLGPGLSEFRHESVLVTSLWSTLNTCRRHLIATSEEMSKQSNSGGCDPFGGPMTLSQVSPKTTRNHRCLHQDS